jgi:hypothetical protein
MQAGSEQRTSQPKTHPLLHARILQRLFEYAGAGGWAYLGTVSKAWTEFYESCASVERAGYNQQGESVQVNASPHMTLYSEVFASPSRLQWVVASGLTPHINTKGVQQLAGRYADIATLMLLRELGLPWTAAVFKGASASKDKAKLHWLVSEQQCPMAEKEKELPEAVLVIDTQPRLAEFVDTTAEWLQEHGGAAEQSAAVAGGARCCCCPCLNAEPLTLSQREKGEQYVCRRACEKTGVCCLMCWYGIGKCCWCICYFLAALGGPQAM